MIRVPAALGMTIIENIQGRAGLFHRRIQTKKHAINTTGGGPGDKGSYFLRNNPDQDSRIIRRKMESNEKAAKKGATCQPVKYTPPTK